MYPLHPNWESEFGGVVVDFERSVVDSAVGLGPVVAALAAAVETAAVLEEEHRGVVERRREVERMGERKCADLP